MDINYAVDQKNLYIYLGGELDEYTAKRAKESMDKEIDEKGYVKNVIFDFSRSSFMDSTGIGVLLGRYKKLKKCGVKCYIRNPSVNIDKVLQISGLYEIMPKIKEGVSL